MHHFYFLSPDLFIFLCQSRLNIRGENMPIPTIQQAFALYETCVKTCNLCDDNSRCNSCKEKTKSQWSTLEKFHFKAPISTFSLATPSTSHSGEKSNKCNQCDFESFQAGDLKKHLKLHSEEKAYKCKECDFAFSMQSNLNKHIEKHRNKKPGKCNHCEFVSYNIATMRKHSKDHNNSLRRQLLY